MKTLDEKEQLELLKNLTYVSIISADNDDGKYIYVCGNCSSSGGSLCDYVQQTVLK